MDRFAATTRFGACASFAGGLRAQAQRQHSIHTASSMERVLFIMVKGDYSNRMAFTGVMRFETKVAGISSTSRQISSSTRLTAARKIQLKEMGT